MSPIQRPGKTAPRLIHDLYDYDPAHPPGTRRNLLSEVPPVYLKNYSGPGDFISSSACGHNYVTKTNQTFVPQLEQGLSSRVPIRISAICVKCRYHLFVVVAYADALAHHNRLLQDHIHHLVYKSGGRKGGDVAEKVTPKGQAVETFHYECSYLTCSMAMSVRVVSPVLNPEFVRILTDPEAIQARADEAFAAQPDRLEGVARPKPITVLENMRAYIRNALHEPQRSKSISAVNKRFMVCFGVDGLPCKELLEFLEFSVENEGFWEPPQPSPWKEVPYQDPLRIFLDDVDYELAVLIQQRSSSENKVYVLEQDFQNTYNDLCYALGVVDYPKVTNLTELKMAPAPFYEDLGVVEDMSSPLVVEAFNRQVSVDPTRAPYYLRCLKEIGSLRTGQDAMHIENAVTSAYGEGKYTDEDIIEAYKYFGLSPDDPNLTDDSIIGKFYAFLSSTIRSQEMESRRQLWIIGDCRRSERIKAAVDDRVSTVEQAQVFLGVDEQTSDDFVITMYTAKVNDNPSSKDLARRAVELIAKARKSDILTHYLNTGEMGPGEMDVGDAYRLLQIPDRTVDDAAIIAAYTICVDEAPGQAETYNRALSIIAREKDSPLLSSLVSGPTVRTDRDQSWPVGLQNIGNTCYLNSLLQFYFSIRPFREMVLDFEVYRMDLNDLERLARKQVGSRKVSIKEVERSQRFLGELKVLFHDMITSPQPWVTPGQELARLTLISSTNEAAIRRRSTITGPRTGALGEINGLPIIGPLGPPQQSTTDNGPVAQANISGISDMDEGEAVKDVAMSDMDSEATLVSDGHHSEPQNLPQDNRENIPDISPRLDTEVNTDAAIEARDQSHVTPLEASVATGRPPVPPRPDTEADWQRQIKEEVEIGAQQDVTEVINNVLFQSECAIKPTAFASDGEQLDRIKDLFYGKTKSYISAEGAMRSKEEWWCDVKVDVATGSRDIYAALDGAFDVQKVDVGAKVAEQFGAISKLPPVLQIQVQRVQFDPVKKTSFKSTNHLELLETIYLDRYMDTQHPEIVNRRKQCWEWKEKVKVLQARRAELIRQNESDGLDMPTLFDSARAVLEELQSITAGEEDYIDVDSDLLAELDQLSQITRTELAFVEQEIKDTQTMIETQFVDFKNLGYRLYAVFMHRGSVSFGHYWIYIFDFRKHVWRKYNDENVTEVQSPDEIFKNDEGRNPPTPYFLVYINDSMKDRLADPVCRDIVDDALNSQPNAEEKGAAKGTVPMEGVVSTQTTSEVANDEPPSYDEARAGGPPGTTTNSRDVSPVSNPLKRKGVEETGKVGNDRS